MGHTGSFHIKMFRKKQLSPAELVRALVLQLRTIDVSQAPTKSVEKVRTQNTCARAICIELPHTRERTCDWIVEVHVCSLVSYLAIRCVSRTHAPNTRATHTLTLLNSALRVRVSHRRLMRLLGCAFKSKPI